MPDDIRRDMVRREIWLARNRPCRAGSPVSSIRPLLHQFAPQRHEKGLTDLDAATRQMPAGDIAVPDQKYPVVGVEHDAADPQRHAAGEAPIQQQNPPQQRLKAPSADHAGSSRKPRID